MAPWSKEFGVRSSRGASIPPPAEEGPHHGCGQHAPPAAVALLGDGEGWTVLSGCRRQENHVQLGQDKVLRPRQTGPGSSAACVLHPPSPRLTLSAFPQEALGELGRWHEKSRQCPNEEEADKQSQSIGGDGPVFFPGGNMFLSLPFSLKQA